MAYAYCNQQHGIDRPTCPFAMHHICHIGFCFYQLHKATKIVGQPTVLVCVNVGCVVGVDATVVAVGATVSFFAVEPGPVLPCQTSAHCLAYTRYCFGNSILGTIYQYRCWLGHCHMCVWLCFYSFEFACLLVVCLFLCSFLSLPSTRHALLVVLGGVFPRLSGRRGRGHKHRHLKRGRLQQQRWTGRAVSGPVIRDEDCGDSHVVQLRYFRREADLYHRGCVPGTVLLLVLMGICQ